jgi:hypothetical protein
MANESKPKDQEEYKPYQPEEPVDEATRGKERQEIRDASRRSAQEMAAEELGNEQPISREQAEKEMQEAARHVQEEKKQSSSS